jgi:oligopeptidase B
MKRLGSLFLFISSLFIVACGETTPTVTAEPPLAKIEPTELEQHGDVRVDNYYWLNQRGTEAVESYLHAENDYTDAMMAHTEPLQATLVKEFTERIKQTDESVPYRLGDYFYYTRTEDGKDYPIYARKPGSTDGAEQVMLDVNELAAGHDGYFNVAGVSTSEDHKLIAFGVDRAGRRVYTIQVKNLETGEMLEDTIPGVTPNITWANDNKTFFYTRQDPTTLRSFQIWKHRLGTSSDSDKMVYEESDETYNCGVGKSKSRDYIMIGCSQTLANEYRFIKADAPDSEFKLFLERKRGHEYDVDHFGDHFFIRTNDGAENFRLMKTAIGKTAMTNWTEVIPARDDVYLSSFEIFKDHLVVSERKEGLIQLQVRPWSGDAPYYLDFGEPAYLAFARNNNEFDTTILRYHYESLTTPDSLYDYDMNSREKTLLKQNEVLAGFNQANYTSERIYATARDGAKVPISLVYRNGTPKDGSAPLLLGGYGSYGSSRDARFSEYRISLLDRGMVYAIAHIRGGQEMGRSWYENGKLLKKMNTFTDFVDCAKHLASEGYTSPQKTVAQGGSAGGLLIGAVINLAPAQFKAAHAAVPFVDVVTTMLDDTIPLTTGEFDEWGNPKVKEYYDYMKSYSPYDNVEAKDYPALLVTTGYEDSQVQYFEPAKWVAKLRAHKTDGNALIFKTEMQAGHGGSSARTKRYSETAFTYAFLLDQVGITE